MKTIVKDGWYLVYGYEVYVEGGEVKRAERGDLTVYPYRINRCGGTDLDSHMSIDELISGLLRASVVMKERKEKEEAL